MALGLIVLALVLALAYAPGMWVRGVLKRHGGERPDLAWTGAAFARQALDGMKLGHVLVEETKLGDHYDPAAKAVRLTPALFRGRSLTAMVVAAHEVGHAMQDATGYAPLRQRTASAKTAAQVERIGGAVMLAAPLLLIVMKSPVVLVFEFIAAAILILSAALMHALTLPVEFDASFKRAMPLLEKGQFLKPADLPAAREILRAAAYTYVASALMTLLDVTRWFRIFRF